MSNINQDALRVAKSESEFRLWLHNKALNDPVVYSALQVQTHFENEKELLRFLVIVLTIQKD
jgi:hypothetical protein